VLAGIANGDLKRMICKYKPNGNTVTQLLHTTVNGSSGRHSRVVSLAVFANT